MKICFLSQGEPPRTALLYCSKKKSNCLDLRLLDVNFEFVHDDPVSFASKDYSFLFSFLKLTFKAIDWPISYFGDP